MKRVYLLSLWLGGIALLRLSLAVCLSAQQIADGTSAATDTAALHAVVRAIKAHTKTIPVRVDPRPLWEDDISIPLNATSFLGLPDSILVARVAALRDAGVDSVDAAAVGQNDACASPWVTSDSSSTDLHRSCPASPMYVFAIGLPRLDTLNLETRVGARQEAQGQANQWRVHVVETYMTHHGASITIYDFLMARSSGVWTFRRRIPVMSID